MVAFLRMLLGIGLLPCALAVALALGEVLPLATGATGFVSTEMVAFIGGLLAFALAWALLGRPVRAYVLGHELTHALWGLLFLARVRRLKVSARGGSVNLSKTNLLITLAPYFFPFYTFVVAILALLVYLLWGKLPWLPGWFFLMGLTWGFHVLFTVSTLAQRQPDVTAYGRIFSWVFIFIGNFILAGFWLVAATPLTIGDWGRALWVHLGGAYGAAWELLVWVIQGIKGALN